MFLILSHFHDETASSVANVLASRHGAQSVKTIPAEQLAAQVGWSHRHGKAGVETNLRLSDSDTVSSHQISVVFNRVRHVPVPHFESSSKADRDYAAAEIHALVLSWLSSVNCPVVNRASVRGLGGANRSLAEWLLLAGRAGLPTRRLRFTTNSRIFPSKDLEPFVPGAGAGLATPSGFQPVLPAVIGNSPALCLEPMNQDYRRVLVVGDDVLGEAAREFREPLLNLAKIADCQLLEVIFARGRNSEKDSWVVSGIDQFPHGVDISEIAAIAGLLECAAGDLAKTVSV